MLGRRLGHMPPPPRKSKARENALRQRIQSRRLGTQEGPAESPALAPHGCNFSVEYRSWRIGSDPRKKARFNLTRVHRSPGLARMRVKVRRLHGTLGPYHGAPAFRPKQRSLGRCRDGERDILQPQRQRGLAREPRTGGRRRVARTCGNSAHPTGPGQRRGSRFDPLTTTREELAGKRMLHQIPLGIAILIA